MADAKTLIWILPFNKLRDLPGIDLPASAKLLGHNPRDSRPGQADVVVKLLYPSVVIVVVDLLSGNA